MESIKIMSNWNKKVPEVNKRVARINCKTLQDSSGGKKKSKGKYVIKKWATAKSDMIKDMTKHVLWSFSPSRAE